MTPLVSIVMAAYNAGSTIAATIDSILAQTYDHFELIIIDDASTDGTAEIIAAYKDARIHVFRNEKNLSRAASANRGIGLATGEFIARMDADDLMASNRLELQVHVLQENPHIGVLGSFAQNIDEAGRKIGINKRPLTSEQIKAESFFGCPMIQPTVMLRRAVIPSDGRLYDERFSRAQDMECWSRLVHDTDFMNLDETLLSYRHQSRKSQKSMKDDLKYFRGLIAERNLGYLLEKPGLDDIKAFKALLGWGKAPFENMRGIADRLRAANSNKKIYDPDIFNTEIARRLSRYSKKNRPSIFMSGTGMTKRKRYLGFLIIAALLCYGAYEGFSSWREEQGKKKTLEIAAQISQLCLKGKTPKDTHEKVEILRSCIHAHTEHKMGPEFYANWRDSSKMAALVLDYMQGNKTTKPEFECSTRSTLLSRALKTEGIDAKSVTIIKNTEKFPDHVILEVADAKGNKWLEDTSYDVSLMKKTDTSKPATLSEFIKGKDIEPCRGSKCGWDLTKADIGEVADLKAFPAAYVREKDKKKSVLYYDTSRFDPHEKGDHAASYCEVKEKWCKKIVPVE